MPFRVLVFLASFLMFQVELLIAKRLLPRFGSSAAVWTTISALPPSLGSCFRFASW